MFWNGCVYIIFWNKRKKIVDFLMLDCFKLCHLHKNKLERRVTSMPLASYAYEQARHLHMPKSGRSGNFIYPEKNITKLTMLKDTEWHCTYSLRLFGIVMGFGPPAQPWALNHRCAASSTSVWKTPSSVSSSGKRAEPSDRDWMSCRLRLSMAAESVVILLAAPSRGVLGRFESKIRPRMYLRTHNEICRKPKS